jgi:hypothetical protein
VTLAAIQASIGMGTLGFVAVGMAQPLHARWEQTQRQAALQAALA